MGKSRRPSEPPLEFEWALLSRLGRLLPSVLELAAPRTLGHHRATARSRRPYFLGAEELELSVIIGPRRGLVARTLSASAQRAMFFCRGPPAVWLSAQPPGACHTRGARERAAFRASRRLIEVSL